MGYQDPCEASHEGREKEYLWQGSGGEGKASQDCCESFPCCCIEKPDLRIASLQLTPGGLAAVGILQRRLESVRFCSCAKLFRFAINIKYLYKFGFVQKK